MKNTKQLKQLNKNIILLTGKKRSGKDASALILKKHLKAETIAFADSLKDAMMGIPLRGVNVRRRELYIDQGKEDHRDLDLKISIHSIFKYIQLVIKNLELDHKITDDQIYEAIEKHDFFSFRKLMQIIGTDLVHPVDQLFWVNKTLDKIKHNKQINSDVIITDCRFLHEHKAAMDLGAITIKINRPDQEHSDQHDSETQDIPYCYLINNTGTLEDLENNLINILKRV